MVSFQWVHWHGTEAVLVAESYCGALRTCRDAQKCQSLLQFGQQVRDQRNIQFFVSPPKMSWQFSLDLLRLREAWMANLVYAANATYCTDLMVLESIWIALGHLCMYIFYLHHNVHLCFVARSIPVSCQEKLRQLRHLLVIHMGQNPVARIEISRAPLDIHKTAPLWPLFTEFHGLKLFHSYFSGPLL